VWIPASHCDFIKHLLNVLLVLFVAGSYVEVVMAQIPHRLSYQGFLKTSAGAPVTTTVPISFRIYDVAVNGVALYSENQSVLVTNGVFSVVIGSITPLSLAFDVPYYLGITVGDDSEMIPREPLNATPYALRAGSTESLDGNATVSASQITGSIDASMLSGHPAADFVLSRDPAYKLPQGCAIGQAPKSDGANGWTCAADVAAFRVSRSTGSPPFTYFCEGTPYGAALGTEAANAVTDCISRANANGGGTVYVKLGIYPGAYNIALAPGVDLVGQGILQPTGAGIAVRGGNLVEGIGIDMSLSGGHVAITAAALGDEDVDDVTIRNVKFYNSGPDTSAIYIDGASYSIGNIKILDNVFSQSLDTSGESIPTSGYCSYGGVIIFNATNSIANSVVSRNVILAKACNGGTGLGVVFAGGGSFNRFVITENVMRGQGAAGQEAIQVLAGSTLQDSLISGNILTNVRTGVDAPSGARLIVSDNRITCTNATNTIGIDIGTGATVNGNNVLACGIGIRARNQSSVAGNYVGFAGNSANPSMAMINDPCGYGGQTYSVGICMQTAIVGSTTGASVRANVTAGYFIGILGWKNLSANCSATGNLNVAFVAFATYPDSGSNGLGNNCNINNVGN
jgi:hypothetical protein